MWNKEFLPLFIQKHVNSFVLVVFMNLNFEHFEVPTPERITFFHLMWFDVWCVNPTFIATEVRMTAVV